MKDNHPIAKWDDFGRLEHDAIVITDSHTGNKGSNTETIPFGTEVSIDTAQNGTKWILYNYQGVNDKGYRTFANRAKLYKYVK